jgi:hypothetical protein
LASTLAAVLGGISEDAADGCDRDLAVKVSRRTPFSPDDPEEERYFNLYGLHQLGELQVDQPIEWLITLPPEPIGGTDPEDPGPADEGDPEDLPCWQRFIAYTRRMGGTVLVFRVRSEGGQYKGDIDLRPVILLRSGEAAWDEIARQSRWEP